MLSLRSFDTLGANGLSMMQKGLDTANAASEKVVNSGGDIMSFAEASMDMSTAKVQMAMGAWLIKSHNDLMESSLQIFGIGQKHSGLY